MNYSDGEAAILTRVQAVSGFDSANTSRGNWKILNYGSSRQYAVLRMGQWENPTTAFTTIHRRFRTVVEVFYRLHDDTTTATGLQGVIQDITASLETYRKMGDAANILRARVSGGSEMMEVERAGVQWFKGDIYIDWQEQESITYAE